MNRTYDLKPRIEATGRLRFDWDADTGALEGPDAERVRALLVRAVAAGRVRIEPVPSSWPISEPEHRPEEMAAILGSAWHLAPDLMDAYPRVPDTEEGGTFTGVDEDGNEQLVDVDLVH